MAGAVTPAVFKTFNMLQLPRQKRIVLREKQAPLPKGQGKFWCDGYLIIALNETNAKRKFKQIHGNDCGSCERLD